MFRLLAASAITILLIIEPVVCLAEQQVQRYKTLADRRDAAFKHELTDWLSFAPSIEFESEVINLDLIDANSYRLRQRSKSAQLDIELSVTDWMKAEAEYEYDDQLDEFVLEEAIAEISFDDFKFELGQLYVPFGEFYSRFVSGPALEFTETRARAIVFSYEPSEQLEAAIYLFKSKVGKRLPDEDNTDWGLAFNYAEQEQFSVGISYLSDLAETDEKLLEDTGFYQRQIGAVSTYANIELGNYEVSLEYVQATGSFSELDAGSNQPAAWNIELGIYPEGSLDWALRIEGSQELEDAPELQVGVNSTWRANKYLSVAVDFLHGRFKSAYVEDDSGNEIKSQNQVTAQLIISF